VAIITRHTNGDKFPIVQPREENPIPEDARRGMAKRRVDFPKHIFLRSKLDGRYAGTDTKAARTAELWPILGVRGDQSQ
jgi:hypothetical protein